MSSIEQIGSQSFDVSAIVGVGVRGGGLPLVCASCNRMGIKTCNAFNSAWLGVGMVIPHVYCLDIRIMGRIHLHLNALTALKFLHCHPPSRFGQRNRSRKRKSSDVMRNCAVSLSDLVGICRWQCWADEWVMKVDCNSRQAPFLVIGLLNSSRTQAAVLEQHHASWVLEMIGGPGSSSLEPSSSALRDIVSSRKQGY